MFVNVMAQVLSQAHRMTCMCETRHSQMGPGMTGLSQFQAFAARVYGFGRTDEFQRYSNNFVLSFEITNSFSTDGVNSSSKLFHTRAKPFQLLLGDAIVL